MSARQKENWSLPLDPDRWPGFTQGHYDICTAVARGISMRIYRRTGIALDEEDLAQSAMEHVLQHCQAWDGKRRGYLWTAARWGAERHAKKLMRRGAKHREREQQTITSTEGDRLIGQHALCGGGPDEEAERSEARAAIRAAMDDLPEREREILRLYHFEQLKGDEIGALLHMSRARVHQLRHQAMGRMRAALSEGLARAG